MTNISEIEKHIDDTLETLAHEIMDILYSSDDIHQARKRVKEKLSELEITFEY